MPQPFVIARQSISIQQRDAIMKSFATLIIVVLARVAAGVALPEEAAADSRAASQLRSSPCIIVGFLFTLEDVRQLIKWR